MPSIWGYDINCITSLPTSPQVCLFSSAGSHGNMVRNHKWTSSGQNWGIQNAWSRGSRIGCLPHRTDGGCHTGRAGRATAFLSSVFLLLQTVYTVVWCDDFNGSRRLCATGRLLGSCMVRSLPTSHHYLLKEVRSTLSPPSDALAARL